VHTGVASLADDGLELGVHDADGADADGIVPLPEVGGGFAVSPDGVRAATLVAATMAPGPEGDADGWSLQLRSGDEDTSGRLIEEPGIVVPAGSVVQDWSGSVAAGATSEVTIVTPEGRLLAFPLTGARPAGSDELIELAWIGERIVEPFLPGREVVAYASAHLGDGRGFVLEGGGDGRSLHAVDVGRVLGTLDVDGLTGDQDPRSLTLDAWGDSAVLSSPEGSWLFPTDGEGTFADPVALPEGTVAAALVGREVDGEPDAATTDEPGDASPDEPGADLDDVIVEEPVAGPLDDGVVTADDRTVTLVRGDGTAQELVTFPIEGESTVASLAVRPGSTPDDLVVAIVTRAEGTFEVRWLEVVDGEVVPDPSGIGFPAAPIGTDLPGGGTAAFAGPDLQDGGEPSVAWSPDGDLLAFVSRPGPGEPIEVATRAWADDGPTLDPDLTATFELDTDLPLTLRRWTWTGAAAGGARAGELLLVDQLAQRAHRVRLDRQADGAPAMPASNPLVPAGGDDVLDLVDADGDGSPDHILRGGPSPRLDLTDGLLGRPDAAAAIELSGAGPRQLGRLVALADHLLVVLDPAEPLLVDRTTGEVAPAPLDGEVVSADGIR
jgi:hypothetical protein